MASQFNVDINSFMQNAQKFGNGSFAQKQAAQQQSGGMADYLPAIFGTVGAIGGGVGGGFAGAVGLGGAGQAAGEYLKNLIEHKQNTVGDIVTQGLVGAGSAALGEGIGAVGSAGLKYVGGLLGKGAGEAVGQTAGEIAGQAGAKTAADVAAETTAKQATTGATGKVNELLQKGSNFLKKTPTIEDNMANLTQAIIEKRGGLTTSDIAKVGINSEADAHAAVEALKQTGMIGSATAPTGSYQELQALEETGKGFLGKVIKPVIENDATLIKDPMAAITAAGDSGKVAQNIIGKFADKSPTANIESIAKAITDQTNISPSVSSEIAKNVSIDDVKAGFTTVQGQKVLLTPAEDSLTLSVSKANEAVNAIQDKISAISRATNTTTEDQLALRDLTKAKSALEDQIDAATQKTPFKVDVEEAKRLFGDQKGQAIADAAEKGKTLVGADGTTRTVGSYKALKTEFADFYNAGDLGDLGGKATLGKQPTFWNSMIGRRLPYMGLMATMGGYSGAQKLATGKGDMSPVGTMLGSIAAGAGAGFLAGPSAIDIGGEALGNMATGGSAVARVLGQGAAGAAQTSALPQNNQPVSTMGGGGQMTAPTDPVQNILQGSGGNQTNAAQTPSGLTPIDVTTAEDQKQAINDYISQMLQGTLAQSGGKLSTAQINQIKSYKSLLTSQLPTAMTQTQKTQATKYNNAVNTLNTVQSLYNEIGGAKGLIGGVIAGSSADAKKYDTAVTTAAPIVAASLGLTGTDKTNFVNNFPKITDNVEDANNKWQDIISQLQDMQTSMSDAIASSSNTTDYLQNLLGI